MTVADPGGHAGDELLAAVAASLSDRLAEISQDVTGDLTVVIEQLRGDSAIRSVLRASVTENIAAVFHVFEHGMPLENIEAPPAAVEYARRLARQGREVALVVAAARRMVEMSAGCIDRVTERVLTAYENGRDRWVITQTAMRAGRVRALLEGKQVDLGTIEAELGYRLRQHHVGLIAWDPEPAPGGTGLARLVRARGQVSAG